MSGYNQKRQIEKILETVEQLKSSKPKLVNTACDNCSCGKAAAIDSAILGMSCGSGKPDPNLAPDEWYAIFTDFQDTTTGTITKVPWQGGSNMTAVYKVKRIM